MTTTMTNQWDRKKKGPGRAVGRFVTDDFVCKWKAYPDANGWRRSHCRAYVEIEDAGLRPACFTKRNRPTEALRVAVMVAVGIEAASRGVFSALDIRWSRVAGCACGCSPGFVVRGLENLAVWVTVVSRADDVAAGA